MKGQENRKIKTEFAAVIMQLKTYKLDTDSLRKNYKKITKNQLINITIRAKIYK